jgi:arylsulfatase A-like enzyme
VNKFIIGFIIVLSINCGFVGAARAETGQIPRFNVVLISLNSLRADHLSGYGYNLNTAPNIEKLAKDGFLFERAEAQSNWTLPSQASLFTSKYVHSHGVFNRDQKITKKELTLPKILKLYGYKTAAFVGGLDMVAEYGLDQGFDSYSDKTGGSPTISFKETMPEILKWLRKNKNEKFFLFIQSYDIHYPYSHPEPYDHMYDRDYDGVLSGLTIDYPFLKTIRNGKVLLKGKQEALGAEDIGHIIAHYDGGITYADKFVGEFLDEIGKLKLSGNTIVILTAEHGDELYDHGNFDRFGKNILYEEVTRVPLIIKNPALNSKGKRITGLVQLVDIMPTVLDFLKIPVNKESQGASLLPLMEGKNANDDFDKYVYAEADNLKRSIRGKEWKLIDSAGAYELYNLVEDPREKNNLASLRPELVYELVQRLSEWHEKTRTAATSNERRLVLTPEMKDRLRKSGYW